MKQIDRWDVVFMIGCALVVFGIGKMYEPAAWIVAGVMLAAVSFLRAK